ncbi:MAG TPA: TonB family protein [Arenimonas sp.]|nr:TonB family protein [Arenimonas sp.]
MQTACAPSPALKLDYGRILGNAGAIALHAIVLALLLAPMQTPQLPTRPIRELPPTLTVPVELRPLPTPPQPEVKPVLRPQPRPIAQPLPQPEPAPVVDDPGPLDVVAEPVVEADPAPAVDFNAGPPTLDTIAYAEAPPPRYPPRALRGGQEGEVLLRVLVDTEGRVQAVTIERSSGHRLLDDAARQQVLTRWRFHPAQRAGHAIAAYALVPIDFSLPR